MTNDTPHRGEEFDLINKAVNLKKCTGTSGKSGKSFAISAKTAKANFYRDKTDKQKNAGPKVCIFVNPSSLADRFFRVVRQERCNERHF